MKAYVFKTMPSPAGELTLVASAQGLAGVLWVDERDGRVPYFKNLTFSPDDAILCEAERQLGEYFAGTRERFDLKLDMMGEGFTRRVWNELLTIPYGETRSYGEIARCVGEPKAARAVGAANGKNPIAIVVPCHRVIGANGKLTGFAGGLEVKAQLLAIEEQTAGLRRFAPR